MGLSNSNNVTGPVLQSDLGALFPGVELPEEMGIAIGPIGVIAGDIDVGAGRHIELVASGQRGNRSEVGHRLEADLSARRSEIEAHLLGNIHTASGQDTHVEASGVGAVAMVGHSADLDITAVAPQHFPKGDGGDGPRVREVYDNRDENADSSFEGPVGVDVFVGIKGNVKTEAGGKIKINASSPNATAQVGHDASVYVITESTGAGNGQSDMGNGDDYDPEPTGEDLAFNFEDDYNDRHMSVEVAVDIKGKVKLEAGGPLEIKASHRNSTVQIGHHVSLNVFAPDGPVIGLDGGPSWGDSVEFASLSARTRGDIVMVAQGDITAKSTGRDSKTRIGHEIDFIHLGKLNKAVAKGDIKIVSLHGDVTFHAKRGRTQVGHDVPSRMSRILKRDDDVPNQNEEQFDDVVNDEIPSPQGKRRHLFGEAIGDIIVVVDRPTRVELVKGLRPH